MTAQVIYLNTQYWPDEEEAHELDKMQEFLSFCHIQFSYETKGLNPHEQKARKDAVHKRARERLGIVRMVNE